MCGVPFAAHREWVAVTARNGQERGFAMMIVLWSLALLGTRMTSTGHTEVQIAHDQRDAAVAEAITDGALYEAAFHVLDRLPDRSVANGQTRRLNSVNELIDLRMHNPRGLINPNSAPPALMAAMIREVGGDPRSAAAIAAAIFEWRTPGRNPSANGAKEPQYNTVGRADGSTGRPFTDLNDLGAVLGITPALLAALGSHRSLYNFGVIDPAHAVPVVARALVNTGIGQPELDHVGPVVLLRIDVKLANGIDYTRRTGLLLRPGPQGFLFRILSWESGAV